MNEFSRLGISDKHYSKMVVVDAMNELSNEYDVKLKGQCRVHVAFEGATHTICGKPMKQGSQLASAQEAVLGSQCMKCQNRFYELADAASKANHS